MKKSILLTLGLGCMAALAQAQPVITTLSTPVVLSSSNAGPYYLDVNSDGGNDLKFDWYAFSNTIESPVTGVNGAEVDASVDNVYGSGYYLMNRYGYGDYVSASSAWHTYGQLQVQNPTMGLFAAQGPCYMACRVLATSGWVYGWVKLDVSFGTTSITISEYGYNSTVADNDCVIGLRPMGGYCLDARTSCDTNDGSLAVMSVSGGLSPYTYLWSNGETTSSISNLGEGTYSCSVTDLSGLTRVFTANVTLQDAPVVDVEEDGNGIFGSIMGDFTSAVWYLDGVLLPNETNYYITNITQNGEYVVEVENDYGCTGRDTVIVTRFTGVNSLDDLNLSLSPNPTSDNITLQGALVEQADLYAMDGRLVFTTQKMNTLDLSQLPAGIYTIRVQTLDGVGISKVIKE